MHFYSLVSDIKRKASYAEDDLLEFDSQLEDMLSKTFEYIPFTGDNNERNHFNLQYQLMLVKSRLYSLEAEMNKLLHMLKNM